MQNPEEKRAALDSALRKVAEQGDLSVEDHDALSVLEGADLESFRTVWSKLAAPARARLLRTLRDVAEQRLRVDYSTLNRLALSDEDAEVRLASVESAIEDASPALLDRLLDMVRTDPSCEVRRAVAEDLARFTLLGELESLHPASVQQLREVLQAALSDPNEDPGVRSSALAALGYFGDEAIMQELRNGFTNPELRLGAIRGMGRSVDPGWTDRLLPVLGAEDPQMRLEAARALQEIEDERAIGPLVDLMDDPEVDVRLAAIHALGVLGGEEAREALLYALEDPDERIREAADAATKELEEAEADPLDL